MRSILNQKWHVYVVLAFGVGTAWGISTFFLGSASSIFFPSQIRNSEGVVFSLDGTPLIETRIGGNYQNTETRTLDGNIIELHPSNRLGAAYLTAPLRKPGLLENPIPWNERIVGTNDNQKALVSWLLMRDGNRPGRAYFVGYDLHSKYCVGYIGRKGFRSSLPAKEEWFDLGNHTFNFSDRRYATTGSTQNGYTFSYRSGNPYGKEHLKSWLFFLAEKNDILEINLLERKVRTLATIDGVESLSTISIPLPLPTPKEDQAPSEKSNAISSVLPVTLSEALFGQVLSFESVVPNYNLDPKRGYANRILARCQDRIVVLNPFDGSEEAYVIPQKLQQKTFSAFIPRPGQMILQANQGKWEQGDLVELLWINPEGEVAREEMLKLQGYVPDDPKKSCWQVAGVVPSLFPWLISTLIVGPLALVQQHKAANYMEGLQETFSICGPAFMAIVVLSAISAWLVYRWQKRYCLSYTPIWCAAVFLGTIPGLIAYWLMHRNLVLDDCQECGQQATRDRDACARCDQPFAKPELLGTEIFA